mgnify:CR=1 FL=1
MKTFEELGVSEDIRRAIEELGFEHPMPVQEEVIPYLLDKKADIIALAQTGTGKTAAYGLPVLQNTDPSNKTTQAVILSPTRELCLQIADDLNGFAKYIEGLHIVAVYGGTDIGSQIRTLKHGVQIIVATPGRLVDLMKRGVAQLETVKKIVLDEADEMLRMGFAEDVETIAASVPDERLTALFSATAPWSARSIGTVATTAAAPQILLPAPISQLVCLSRPKTFWPIKQASKKVLVRVRTSMAIPLTPTSAICEKVRRKP